MEPILKELKKLSKNSYAKYSNFNVACLIEMNDKSFVKGVNIENGSFPNSMCAEKSAIGNAITNGINLKNAINVYIYSPNSKNILSPCGSCRQVLSEHINLKTMIYMFDNKDEFKKMSLGELIPLEINLENLKEKI